MAESSADFAFPIEPCFHPERGDGFAAARDLQAGELVLRVAPLAAVPKDKFITRVCANCFQPGHAARPGPATDASHQPATAGGMASTSGAGTVPGCRSAAAAAGGGRLALCGACKAVSYCARCLQLDLVQANHKQECEALGALLRMHQPQPRPEAKGSQRSRDRRDRSNAGLRSGAAAAAKEQGPASSVPPCTAGQRGEQEGTATLRLVLSIACWVARARQNARTGRERKRTSASVSERRASAEGSVAVNHSDGNEEQDDGTDGRYGPGDVIQDSLEDLEQLMGDPEEDLPAELLPRFTQACAALKSVQPAWARASLHSYLRWATKVRLNEHDIHVNLGPADVDSQAAASAVGTAGMAVGVQAVAGTGAGEAARGAQKQPTAQVAVSCREEACEHSQAAARGGGTRRAGKRQRTTGRGNEPPASGSPQGPPNPHPPMQSGSAGEAQQPAPVLHAVGEGLFPSVARLNHSCAPNCRLRYDGFGCLEVRTVQPVAKGEELFAAYINPQVPVEARRQHLYDSYGFWCKCSACSVALACEQ